MLFSLHKHTHKLSSNMARKQLFICDLLQRREIGSLHRNEIHQLTEASTGLADKLLVHNNVIEVWCIYIFYFSKQSTAIHLNVIIYLLLTDNSMYWRSIPIFLYGCYKYQRHSRNDPFKPMYQLDWHRNNETNCWNWWSHTYRLDAMLSSAWHKPFGNGRFRRNRLRFLWNGTFLISSYFFENLQQFLHLILPTFWGIELLLNHFFFCKQIGNETALISIFFQFTEKNPIETEWQLSNNID